VFNLLRHVDFYTVSDVSKKRKAFIFFVKKFKKVAAPLPLQLTLKKKALWAFETLTIILNSTRCNIIEDLNLNSKYFIVEFFK
jgi:hypothetical protein